MRRVGSSWAAKIVVGFVGLLLLGAFLDQVAKLTEPGGGGPNPPCVGPPEATVTASQVNSSAPLPNGPALPAGGALPDAELGLSVLADLSISNTSSAIDDLSNVTHWHEVIAEWRSDVLAIAPQTYIGFINDSTAWNSWALQNIPNPPPWLSTGFIPFFGSQVAALDDLNGTQKDAALLGFVNIKLFAASVAGTSLAGLDFITFNGLTSLKTYFETGDASQAMCETFPAQLAALYVSAFDPNVPGDLRAQYLGRALAITTFMLALGGAKDGILPKLQAAIDSEGLGAAWPTIKPYLGENREKASGAASTATLSILQTMAARFPQDSVWATGLTAFRVDCMVDVLKDDGLPNDLVQNDIQKVAQAASSSTSEDGPSGVADESSYDDGHWVDVLVRSQNRMSLYYDSTGKSEPIKISFLQAEVPGFDPTKAELIQISYQDANLAVYNYYGGPGDSADGVDTLDGTWTPKVPGDVASPGDLLTVQFSLLTPEAFVNRMPDLQFSGFLENAPWMTIASQVTGYAISDGELKIEVQEAPFAGLDLRNFEIDGMQPTLGFDSRVTYLDFQVVDAFGQPTEMRLVYNGYSDPQLRISSGGANAEFSQVLLISSDGVKLKFLEDTGGGETSVATIYVQAPTTLYTLGEMGPGDSSYLVSGASAVFQIDQVTTTRALEETMATQGAPYDLGRVGAEIAYSVGTEKLGLQGLILAEPSEGGADLKTADGTAVIQARFVDLSGITDSADVKAAIQGQLTQMVLKIGQDFKFNPSANVGYAVISYLDNQDVIRTIIVQVQR